MGGHKRKRRLQKRRVFASKNIASPVNKVNNAYSKGKSNPSDGYRCSEFVDYLLEEIKKKGNFSDSDLQRVASLANKLTKLDLINLICFSLVHRWFKPLDNPELRQRFLAIDFRIPYQHPWPCPYILTDLFPIQFLMVCGANKYVVEAIKHDKSQGELLERPVEETTLHSRGTWFECRKQYSFQEKFPDQYGEYLKLLKLKKPSDDDDTCCFRMAWSYTTSFFSNVGCRLEKLWWGSTQENNQESNHPYPKKVR